MSYFVIVASSIDNTQRTLVHESVKALTDVWWHQWEDTWVIEADVTTNALSDRLLPFFYVPGSEVLILPLKDAQTGKSGGRFAGRVSKTSADWFNKNLNGRSVTKKASGSAALENLLKAQTAEQVSESSLEKLLKASPKHPAPWESGANMHGKDQP